MDDKWEHGDIVQDAEANVAQRVDDFGTTGWYVLGWQDGLYDDSDLVFPLTRLVPVEEPPPGKADPYLYRITYNDGSVKHGRRNVLGPVVGHAKANNTHWHKRPCKIERALSLSWEDCTEAFLGSCHARACHDTVPMTVARNSGIGGYA